MAYLGSFSSAHYLWCRAATAWLMLIGSPTLSKRRRAQQRTMNEYMGERAETVSEVPDLARLFAPPFSPRYAPFVHLNTTLGALPACTGNTIDLLPDYDGSIQAIADAVNRAQRFVHVEYYVLARDKTTEPFFVALEQVAKRGGDVTLITSKIGDQFWVLDMRSLMLNLDVTLVAYDERVVSDLRQVEADYAWRSTATASAVQVQPWRG